MQINDPRTGELAHITNGEEYHAEIRPLWMPCKHPQGELRRFTTKSGSTQARQQCTVCGLGYGNAVGGVDHKALPAADDQLAERYRAEVKARIDEITIRYIDAQQGRDEEWWARYNTYLQTPEWRERRDLVLKRCDWTCEGCGRAEATEVHHMTYEHVFEEFLFELKGLCHNCHVRWHASEQA